MKKIFYVLTLVFLLFATFNLTSCKYLDEIIGSETEETNQGTGNEEDDYTYEEEQSLEDLVGNPEDYEGDNILPNDGTRLPRHAQEGVILHAWNWSYQTIEKNLEAIKDAGFKTIQVSPVQQPKDYGGNKNWHGEWWKLYQPLSFKIAERSWLGTATELTSLCKKAHSLGLFIIADIVSNHLAGGHNNDTIHNSVGQYDPELYAKRNEIVHPHVDFSDGSVESVVLGNIGMPDLDTSNKYVQERVGGLLKDCIDCGIDGFRFDAAKHIETPSDKEYASDFWPTVLGISDEYAKTKGKEMYYYGEILNTPGVGRGYKAYTKFMSVTDNKAGNRIREAIVNHDPLKASYSEYSSNLNPSKVVLWAESHDTYANREQESTKVSERDINKTWAIVGARKDATALYFARPGEMGSMGSQAFKNKEVKAVNQFHNAFIHADEEVYNDGNFICVERFSKERQGLVIVNGKTNSAKVEVTVKHLPDGSYMDRVSGNEFEVKNHVVSGEMDETGIVVLTKIRGGVAPTIKINPRDIYFTDSLHLEISFKDFTGALIEINGVKEYVHENKSYVLGENLKDGSKIELRVTAINGPYRLTERITFVKGKRIDPNAVTVMGFDPKLTDQSVYRIYAWVWGNGHNGSWVLLEGKGDVLTFKPPHNEDNFLLAVFKKDYIPTNSDSFKQALYKTADQKLKLGSVYSIAFNKI